MTNINTYTVQLYCKEQKVLFRHEDIVWESANTLNRLLLSTKMLTNKKKIETKNIRGFSFYPYKRGFLPT